MKNKRFNGVFRGLFFVMALAGCSTENELYCDDASTCADGLICEGNACITPEIPDAAGAQEDAGEDPAMADAGTEDAAEIPAVCPEATHQCVPSSPEGWSGPAIRSEALAGLPVDCPTGFEADEHIGGQGAIDQSGSCSCSCGETSSLSCGPGLIEGRDGAIDLFACFAECTSDYCTQQYLSDGVCTAISPSVSSKNLMTRWVGRVTGGSCSPGELTQNFDEPSFESQIRLCTAEAVEGECDDSNVCAPKPRDGFSQNMCIFQEGTHECPVDSMYTERVVIYDGTQDQRSCGSCDCSVPYGRDCGQVDLYSDDSTCGNPLPANTSPCSEDALLSGRAKFTKSASKACSPVEESPDVVGSVTATGATTVCCVL
ncbi:MAG: hypothetical protein JKY56_03595 [Kofleriaceae bacterium]|nr:hypothetical protein [Kofleriaceae bacterium]